MSFRETISAVLMRKSNQETGRPDVIKYFDKAKHQNGSNCSRNVTFEVEKVFRADNCDPSGFP